MKRLFIIVSVLLCVSAAYAQIGKVASKAAKLPQKSVTAYRPPISYYAGSRGAVMGVDFHLTRAAATATAQTTGSHIDLPVSAPITRSWLTQQQRNLKAWQLKRERTQIHLAQLKKAEHLAAIEAAKATAPQLLPEDAFTVANFANYLPLTHQQPKPDMPFVAEPTTVAFRGLALGSDGDAIRNILTNGLLLKDAGEENSTLRIAYASHGGYDAIKHFVDHPVTNVTYGPQSAASWGARRLGNSVPILTVVKIRGSFVGNSMEVVTQDIPASQIEEIIVRLNLNGTLTWCKVELNADETFTLTPYQLANFHTP